MVWAVRWQNPIFILGNPFYLQCEGQDWLLSCHGFTLCCSLPKLIFSSLRLCRMRIIRFGLSYSRLGNDSCMSVYDAGCHPPGTGGSFVRVVQVKMMKGFTTYKSMTGWECAMRKVRSLGFWFPGCHFLAIKPWENHWKASHCTCLIFRTKAEQWTGSLMPFWFHWTNNEESVILSKPPYGSTCKEKCLDIRKFTSLDSALKHADIYKI